MSLMEKGPVEIVSFSQYTWNTLCAKKTSSCKTAIIIVVTIEKFRFHKKMSFDVRHPAALETKG